MTSMYRVEPLFDVKCVNVKTSMYRMSNIHETSSHAGDFVCNGASDKDEDYSSFIEVRQEQLLKRLKELRELLSAPIISPVPSPKIDSRPTSITKMGAQIVDLAKCGITQDIVLNVNPSYLPYSLLGITKLWNAVFSIQISCHTHSSIRSLPKAALEFQEKLMKLSSAAPVNGQLKIKLVWKEDERSSCIFVISPLKSVPVFGEVNFLRFLHSCVSESLNPLERTVLDDKLDSCFALSVDSSRSTVQSHSTNLFSNLNKSKWLLGNELSIVDLAAWSVVTRQSKSISLDSAGKQWFQNCINAFSS